jgi:glutaconate CoA-transferase subunit B
MYSPTELMIVAASRELADSSAVAVGTGLPCAAAMLAQLTHAPGLLIMFEAGGVAPRLSALPVSVGDEATYHMAAMATGMADVMQFAQKGMIDYTFLGGAQIDPYGNLNSTMIGTDHARPKVRLPGSGGANDLASFCRKTLTIMKQDAKKFVPKLDFLTTPGYLSGPGAREAAGLPPGTGPHRVITDLAVLDYHPETKRMRLLAVHAGHTIDEVRDHTGFELPIADDLKTTLLPTDEELRTLRERVDPGKVLLGKG